MHPDSFHDDVITDLHLDDLGIKAMEKRHLQLVAPLLVGYVALAGRSPQHHVSSHHLPKLEMSSHYADDYGSYKKRQTDYRNSRPHDDRTQQLLQQPTDTGMLTRRHRQITQS
jgi:hypothetical protein